MNIGKNSCMQRVNKLAKIRFKGYDISLERKTIGDITTSFSGGTPKSSNKSYYEGNIPFIRSGEVKSKQTELFISDEALNNSSAKLVEKGDILYALYGATSGEVAISQINGAINQAILAIKPKPGYSSEFMMNYLKKEKDNILEKYLQGGQGNLSAAIVKSIELSLPSLDEQSAIGSLFRTLDDLLASYKDNLANFQSLKSTMLSKMFPKAGQTVPEIRLEGFERKWQKYYLGDIFEQVSNYIEPSVENKLWSLTVEKGLTPKTDRYKRDFLVKKNDKFKKVDLNEFVYNPMNLTLGALDLNDNEVTISVSGYYVVMKNRNMEKFDNDFLKILLKTTYAIYQYKQFATGTLIEKQRVQFPTFSEIPFYLPPIAEQQAIGAYFSNFDNLINSYQEKISQLETLKKKLLQDMFI